MLCPQLSHSFSMKGIQHLQTSCLIKSMFYNIVAYNTEKDYYVSMCYQCPQHIFCNKISRPLSCQNNKMKNFIPDSNHIRIRELFVHNCWYTKHDEKLFTPLQASSYLFHMLRPNIFTTTWFSNYYSVRKQNKCGIDNFSFFQ